MFDLGAVAVSTIYINDMPKSLKFCPPSMYADDTEIYASAKDGDELVTNINSDLENVRTWMLQNKLQIHPTKTKHMYILDRLLILKTKLLTEF